MPRVAKEKACGAMGPGGATCGRERKHDGMHQTRSKNGYLRWHTGAAAARAGGVPLCDGCGSPMTRLASTGDAAKREAEAFLERAQADTEREVQAAGARGGKKSLWDE